MSKIRFLADEDLRRSIVLATRRLEPALEIIRGQDLGLSGKTDADVLELASVHGYVVVTHDIATMPVALDARLRSGLHSGGLLLAPQFKSSRSIAESLVLIWSASESEEYIDRVFYLPL